MTGIIEDTQNSGRQVGSELIQVAWSRFVVQNQGMIFDALRMSEILRKRKNELQQTENLLIMLMMGIFLLILLIISLFINRQVLGSIGDLSRGTEIIAGGDLNYRIRIRGYTEIAELSDKLNQMTARLQTVISELRQTEESLTIANKKITLLTSLTRHDIINYVTALIVTIDMMKEVTDPGKMQRLASTCEEISASILSAISFTKECESFSLPSTKWLKLHLMIASAADEVIHEGVRIENRVSPGIEV